MTTRAYNISYLDDAMLSLGAMLDYAVNTCGESLTLFFARFLSSGIARDFSRANPKFIAGMSGIELAHMIARLTGEELPKKEAYVDIGSPEYWTGWTLAYLSWYLCLDFDTLQSRGFSIQSLHDRYPVLHEADLSKSVEFALNQISGEGYQNPLKQTRNYAGMTQQELADSSGVPLRVIRSYEQGQRSLNNASADNVRRICQSLGCSAEQLRSAHN